MNGSARGRHMAEFMRSMYPAFSRRATQVCILSSALEMIAFGAPDAPAIARSALDEADAFGWKQRATAGRPEWLTNVEDELRKVPGLDGKDIEVLTAMASAGVDYADALKRRRAEIVARMPEAEDERD